MVVCVFLVGAKAHMSMADPGNYETWGIVVLSIAVIAPSPVVETPPPIPSLEKKNRLPAVCPLLQNLRERRKNVPRRFCILPIFLLRFFTA